MSLCFPIPQCAAALLALCPLLACAQSATGWSLSGGADLTWYNDPLGGDHGPHTGRSANGVGYRAGAGYEWAHRRPLGFCVEMAMNVRSAGYDFDESQLGYPPSAFDDGHDRGRRSMRTASVEMPILLVWRRLPGLRFDAGPCLSWLAQATEISKGMRQSNGEEERLDQRTDRAGDLSKWEFSLVAGFMVEGPHGLNFQVRYLNGFTDLDAPTGDGPSYTSQVQVGLVYVIGHGAASGTIDALGE